MAKRKYVGRITKSCETCGAEVTRRASHFKPHTFCSRQCYFKSELRSEATRELNRKMYPGERMVEVACLSCGAKSTRYKSQVSKQNFCSRPCQKTYAVTSPVRQITSSGYVKIFVGRGAPGAAASGHILEHRLVMQQLLGRTLLRSEDVHHINGDRKDNRPENLELWSTSQPRGQRIPDKLAWAREFIALYEDAEMT